MSIGFPLMDFLDEIASGPGTTDVTLVSDGRVAVRRNARLAVSRVESLARSWSEIIMEYFPSRPEASGVGTAFVFKGRTRRYRAIFSSHSGGASLSVRPLSESVATAEELRLPDGLEDYFLGLKNGLVLVCGATGSGKSTTVATLLNSRKLAGGGKIITLEDPVEFVHEDDERTLFIQREIGRSVAGYAEGLREALQMNPDVIAVQEIREKVAAETALAAALSGHLVVASMHAFSAATAPQRYLSVLSPETEDFGAREALASCLEAVVLQRLLPGFDGLVPIFEVMLFRHRGERLPSMERSVRQGNWVGLRQEMETGRRYGMMQWDDCLKERVARGLLPSA